jgi:hypothetical protein
MSEPMTPDPNEVLTVALTAEQAEHVRHQLLADFASGLEMLADASVASLRDASRHADTYRAKVESLGEVSPITYADRRCELVHLADDLLATGADMATHETDLARIREHDCDEAAARERGRRLAPALTGAAILEQFAGREPVAS